MNDGSVKNVIKGRFLDVLNILSESAQVKYAVEVRGTPTRLIARGDKDESAVQACQITPPPRCSGMADCNLCMLDYHITRQKWY